MRGILWLMFPESTLIIFKILYHYRLLSLIAYRNKIDNRQFNNFKLTNVNPQRENVMTNITYLISHLYNSLTVLRAPPYLYFSDLCKQKFQW